MQKPQYLVRVMHVANPRIPAAIFKAASKAGEDEDHDERGKGWVLWDDDVGDHAEGGRNVGDAAPAEHDVDAVDDEGGGNVADDWREEDEGDFGVGEVVIRFELEEGG